MSAAHADLLRASAAYVKAAEHQRADALDRRRLAIAGARAAGMTLDAIAGHAGISRKRVLDELRHHDTGQPAPRSSRGPRHERTTQT